MQTEKTMPESGANLHHFDRSKPHHTDPETSAEKLLPISKVMDCTGFGSSYIYALIKEGKFPSPIKVGMSSRWRNSQVQAWISQRIAEGTEGASA